MEVGSRGDRKAVKGMEWNDYWKSCMIVESVVRSGDRVRVSGFWVLSKLKWPLFLV